MHTAYVVARADDRLGVDGVVELADILWAVMESERLSRVISRKGPANGII